MAREPLRVPQTLTLITRSLAFLLAIVLPAAAQPAGDLVARGDALEAKRRDKEALELYLEADKLKPGDAEILRRVAKQYAQRMVETKDAAAQKKLSAKALAAALRAKELAPRNAKVRLSLAIVYGRIAFLESPKRQIEMSRLIKEETDAAISLDPKDSLAWHVLGRWNYELANLNPFLKSIAQAVFGKLPDASKENAVEAFRKSIALGPTRLVNHVELGRALAAVGQKDEARAELTKALAMPPTGRDDEEAKARARKALAEL